MALGPMEYDSGTQKETLSTSNYAIYNDKAVTIAIMRTDMSVPADGNYHTLFTLPQKLRPKYDVYQTTSINGGTNAIIYVKSSTGNVQIYTANALANQWVHGSVTYAL